MYRRYLGRGCVVFEQVIVPDQLVVKFTAVPEGVRDTWNVFVVTVIT